MSTITDRAAITRKGGSWLIEETAPADIFTPERLSDEHRLMARTALDFITQEVMPRDDALEAKDWKVARDLIKRCGDLGLMGTDVPEEFGGLDLDKAAAVVVAEGISRNASFGTAFGAHDQPEHPAAALLRHRGAETEVSARARQRRDRRRLRAQRIGLGLGCARREDARDAAGRTAASC